MSWYVLMGSNTIFQLWIIALLDSWEIFHMICIQTLVSYCAPVHGPAVCLEDFINSTIWACRAHLKSPCILLYGLRALLIGEYRAYGLLWNECMHLTVFLSKAWSVNMHHNTMCAIVCNKGLFFFFFENVPLSEGVEHSTTDSSWKKITKS